MNRTTATVTSWRADEGGVVEGDDLPGSCWVDASAVDETAGTTLRTGQAVDVEWAEPGPPGHACRAVHVTVRDDLQGTPGG